MIDLEKFKMTNYSLTQEELALSNKDDQRVLIKR